MTLTVITSVVPCGTCDVCCRNDAIFMHPECGDDASQYETEPYDGRLILKHKPNGDCIYLDRGRGCSIHDRRPAICREMDCRLLLAKAGEKRLRRMGMGEIAYAARRVNRDGVGSSLDAPLPPPAFGQSPAPAAEAMGAPRDAGAGTGGQA